MNGKCGVPRVSLNQLNLVLAYDNRIKITSATVRESEWHDGPDLKSLLSGQWLLTRLDVQKQYILTYTNVYFKLQERHWHIFL